MSEQQETFEGWAILELMGHRRLAGYVRESELAGQGVLRLDVPEHAWNDGCTCGSKEPASLDHEQHTYVCQMFRDGDAPADVYATQFYAPSSLYCLTPTTEELARGLATRTRPAPVHRWELPAPRVDAYQPPPYDDDDEPELHDEHSEAEWAELQQEHA